MKRLSKILLITLVIITGIGIIGAVLLDESEAPAVKKYPPLNSDSLIAEIKKDKVFHVKSAQLTNDSNLIIEVSDKKANGAAKYFNEIYSVIDTTHIQEITVLRNNGYQSSFGYRTGAIIKKFLEKNFIGEKCRAINQAIKNTMNDPDSFEHFKTAYNYIGNGEFQVETIFSGKNAFNATITNTAYATMTTEGNMLKFSIQ